MTHAKIRKLTASDLPYFTHTTDMEELGRIPGSIEALLINPDSYAITINDQPVALGGVTIPWDGVGEAWVIIDKEKVFPRVLFACKDLIELMETKHKFRRFQACCSELNYENLRFARWCGFVPEARLARHWIDGSNTIVLVR